MILNFVRIQTTKLRFVVCCNINNSDKRLHTFPTIPKRRHFLCTLKTIGILFSFPHKTDGNFAVLGKLARQQVFQKIHNIFNLKKSNNLFFLLISDNFPVYFFLRPKILISSIWTFRFSIRVKQKYQIEGSVGVKDPSSSQSKWFFI